MSITTPTETHLASGPVLISLHDGVFNAPADILADPESEAATAALRAEFRDGLAIDVNAFLLKRDGALILIDAGCGTGYGPTMGRVPQALASLGIEPGDIGTVLVTHPHGDHILGLFDDAGEALRYPAAEVFVPEIDMAHFGGASQGEQNPHRVTATRLFGLLGGQLHAFGPGEVLPGIEAVSLPGHTPGMSGFVIGDEVLIWADVMHLMSHQPQKPAICLAFDEDKELAATTRREAMAMAAARGWTVGGMHLPVPGLATVRIEGDTFRMERRAG